MREEEGLHELLGVQVGFGEQRIVQDGIEVVVSLDFILHCLIFALIKA